MATATISAWSSGELAGGQVAHVTVVGEGAIPPRTVCDLYVTDATWHGIPVHEQRAVYARARALLMCGHGTDALALVRPWADGTLGATWWALEWAAGKPPG